MRKNKLIDALIWGVRNKAFTLEQARGTVALAKFCGVFSRVPDGKGSSSNVRAKGQKMETLKKKSDPQSIKGTTAAGIMNGARVKDASERLSTVKHVVKGRDGNPLRWGSKAVETASEKEHAITGVWMKHNLKRAGVPVVFTEFEKALLHEAVTKGKWCGEVAGTYYGGGTADDYVPNAVVKALLDDTTSGGIFLAPVEFDNNIVTFPLLNGEVFPLVDVVPVTGRRIQSATVGNLSMSWGASPGTSVTPFNTSALVKELATPVWPLSGAIELSNELMSDSPVNIGSTVTALYSERMKTELDRVIVAGNGTSEPLGVANMSGLVQVGSDNGTAGPPTVSDYEGLVFAIQKQYREAGWNPAFVGNDTSYRRARCIQVGAGDERRVFGMDHQSYQLLDYPYRIQNDVPNNRVMFGCWKRYRMYQRLGAEVTVTREGRSLALANTTLVVVRSRFGGQPIDGNGFAVVTDAQS